MQTNNRSGLQCSEHPRQQITNFCVYIDCLKPLCPDCVEIHTKNHQKQEIQSWKHCINKSISMAKGTLDELKSIYEIQRSSKGFKSVEIIEAQNLRKLANLRERYHKLIEDTFNSHEMALRNHIRSQYKIDMHDTSKLKAAIEEMEKLMMKMTNLSTVVGALKKCRLLDHRALVQFFIPMKDPYPKVVTESFFQQNSNTFSQVKATIQKCIGFQDFQQSMKQQRYESPYRQNRYSNHISIGNSNDPFEPLKIYNKQYFKPDCKNKLLHFFIPCSFELKVLRIDDVQKGNWRSINFKAAKQLPYYYKSIITPSGEIYLTGGSEEQQRCKEIFRYNFEKNSLEKVGSMLNQRSSHSICFLNNSIYIVGGFSQADGQVTRQCEVFSLQTMTSSAISPLNTPSANSCTTSFKDQFIFKFGGIFNKLEGNSLIEMYSVKSNRWIVVNIEIPKNIPTLQLLSFSAAVQINESDILVFGGYDNSETEKPERLCYALTVNPEKNVAFVKNYNTNPLPFAEAFWDNNPIVYKNCVYALQNITDQHDELTALADQRRVIVFNGEGWL